MTYGFVHTGDHFQTGLYNNYIFNDIFFKFHYKKFITNITVLQN